MPEVRLVPDLELHLVGAPADRMGVGDHLGDEPLLVRPVAVVARVRIAGPLGLISAPLAPHKVTHHDAVLGPQRGGRVEPVDDIAPADPVSVQAAYRPAAAGERGAATGLLVLLYAQGTTAISHLDLDHIQATAALLTRLLGINISVAVAWQRASSGDWSNYAADYSRRKTSPLRVHRTDHRAT